MRRWVCIVALLAGFAGDDYVRGIRLREPVAVERLIEHPPARDARPRTHGGVVVAPDRMTGRDGLAAARPGSASSPS